MTEASTKEGYVMMNVGKYRDHALHETGVTDGKAFCSLSLEHAEFWYELHGLSAANPEKVEDIDAATEISPEKWDELDEKLDALNA